jgi:hypothetical protein
LDLQRVVGAGEHERFSLRQRRPKPFLSLPEPGPEFVALPAEHGEDRLLYPLRIAVLENPSLQARYLGLEPRRSVRDRLGEGAWQHPIQVRSVSSTEPELQKIVDHHRGALTSVALLTLRDGLQIRLAAEHRRLEQRQRLDQLPRVERELKCDCSTVRMPDHAGAHDAEVLQQRAAVCCLLGAMVTTPGE